MGSSWQVNDLEIVGYAEVLKETMLPSVVPPVFRLKADPQRVLVPPYSFNAGILCNATEVPWPEAEAMRDAREITLFEQPIAARPRYELWLDQSFKPHYEPREQAEKTLDGIATESIERAKAALAAADIKEVERFTGIAISANDRRAEPFAIRAAIRRRQGNKAGEAVMAKLAARAIGEADFAVLVDRYCRSRRPMQGVARLPVAA